jgi:hypothetical protein
LKTKPQNWKKKFQQKILFSRIVLSRLVKTLKIILIDFNSTKYWVINFPRKISSLHISVLICVDQPFNWGNSQKKFDIHELRVVVSKNRDIFGIFTFVLFMIKFLELRNFRIICFQIWDRAFEITSFNLIFKILFYKLWISFRQNTKIGLFSFGYIEIFYYC